MTNQVMQGIAHRRAFWGCALGALLAPALCSAAVLAHWSFDDNLNDVSGANRHLAASGGATITTGASRFGGGSLRTDGTDDFVYRDDVAFDFGVNDFAISFWYLRNDNHAADSLLGQGHSTSNDGYHARIDGGARLEVLLDDDDKFARAYVPAPDLDNSAFQHVVMQRAGDVLQLYVNGALVATDNGNDLLNVSSSTAYAFAIGARNIRNDGTIDGTLANATLFNGWIDEVWVYDQALTAGQISSGYSNNFAAIPEPGTMTSVLVGLALLRFVRNRRSAGRTGSRRLVKASRNTL